LSTPGFAPDEAGTIDNHLDRVEAFGGLLPPNFVVTDIEPAPANFAGATVATTGGYKHATRPRPIVLINQGGHWQITHDSAMTVLDALWNAGQRVPRLRAVSSNQTVSFLEKRDTPSTSTPPPQSRSSRFLISCLTPRVSHPHCRRAMRQSLA